jgi:CheY-like chemotaxis protein
MPEMQGFELYTQLKSIHPDINICFLMAPSEAFREELMKEGYNEVSGDLFCKCHCQQRRL